jgi:hypothetical protein
LPKRYLVRVGVSKLDQRSEKGFSVRVSALPKGSECNLQGQHRFDILKPLADSYRHEAICALLVSLTCLVDGTEMHNMRGHFGDSVGPLEDVPINIFENEAIYAVFRDQPIIGAHERCSNPLMCHIEWARLSITAVGAFRG